jgi:hypothetical protein
VVKPSLLEACFDVIESEEIEVTKKPKKSDLKLKVEYIKSALPTGGRSSTLVSVEESLRRQQDIFGRICQLR